GGIEVFHTDLKVGTTAIDQPTGISDKPYQIMYSTQENKVEIVWKNGDPGRVDMFDAMGRPIIVKDDLENSIQRIDLESFPPGIYFVRIEYEHRLFVEKIMDIE
ncbi:MAG: T9SS type A sorting domain-containing protein, partial [Saprospiraceae bacterium]